MRPMHVLIALFTACLLALAPVSAQDFPEIDWLELMPEDEIKMLEEMQGMIDHSGDAPAMEFNSTRTVPEVDGRNGKIVGYIVPLSVNETNEILEFFLVPYFGACIHVPPPPPNQLIHVKADKPIPMVNIWDPYWVEGSVRIRPIENSMAKASYSMDPVRVVPYE
jgi:uncharacterized protein